MQRPIHSPFGWAKTVGDRCPDIWVDGRVKNEGVKRGFQNQILSVMQYK